MLINQEITLIAALRRGSQGPKEVAQSVVTTPNKMEVTSLNPHFSSCADI